MKTLSSVIIAIIVSIFTNMAEAANVEYSFSSTISQTSYYFKAKPGMAVGSQINGTVSFNVDGFSAGIPANDAYGLPGLFFENQSAVIAYTVFDGQNTYNYSTTGIYLLANTYGTAYIGSLDTYIALIKNSFVNKSINNINDALGLLSVNQASDSEIWLDLTGYFIESLGANASTSSPSISNAKLGLDIAKSGANSVRVTWANVAPYVLQQATNLTSTNYTTVTNNPVPVGTAVAVTLPASGNQFFRLVNPNSH